MSDTNDYWLVRGSYDEKKAVLAAMPKEQLEAIILDGHYNDFIAAHSSFRNDEEDPRGYGKRIPYIGWFWRHVRFSDLASIAVGNSGEFIGFMENNKWDYPERYLTTEEARDVIAIIDEAIVADRAGGNLAEIIANTNAHIDRIWNYMQTIEVSS